MMSNVLLYCGDCIECMDKIGDGSIDMILADFPYQITDLTWDAIIPFAPLWEQLKRVIKPKGAIVLFGSQPFTSALIMSNTKWFKHTWVWNKGNCGSFANAKVAPLRFHEDIVVFCSGSPTYNPQYINAGFAINKRGGKPRNLGMGREKSYVTTCAYKPNDNDRYPNTILEFSNGGAECNSMYRFHPTQKPTSLLCYLIKTYTNPGETVLDCTMGSGSTIVAAVQTGRKGIGIEKDETYYDIAVKRIVEAQREVDGLPKQLIGHPDDFTDMPLFVPEMA